MSTVDKFGRPLPSGGEGTKSGAAAVVEGIQLDSDMNYDARERRIKKVGEATADSDAINLKQMLRTVQNLKEVFDHELVLMRKKFYDLLDGKMDIKPTENEPTVYEMDGKIDDGKIMYETDGGNKRSDE